MKKTLIIAEAGVNHNGSMDLAKELVQAAASAGADIVKFQSFRATELVAAHAEKAAYQKVLTERDESQLEMVRKLELSEQDHEVLLEECGRQGIEFLSTPFDADGVDYLVKLGVKRIKVPSGDITNLPYLRRVGSQNMPTIVSTGMATMQEIKSCIDVLRAQGLSERNLSILHCNTEYPTPFSDVNLNAMPVIKKEFNVSVGYSDHTIGIAVSVAAAAIGAEIIEKHFTLDKGMPGPDHRASIEPDELATMVRQIRIVDEALGEPEKKPSPSELKNIEIARKSIVARIDITEGDIFNERNLAAKRPGTGITPMLWDKVIGKKARRDFKQDELIEL